MAYWKSHGSPGEPAMSGGTLDIDIRTVGGSTVGDTIPVSGTVDISGLSGTLDVDIKTLGGSLVPAGPLPVDATCSTVHADAVSGTCTLGDDSSNSPYQWADTGDNCITYPSYLFGCNGATWDRLRTTGAMSGSTLSTGLLAIGEFGYDGSAWRAKAVNSSGYMIVTGTVDTGIAGTQDVDIKTLGGSLVPAGPLPTESRMYGYDGANWDEIKTTEAVSGGTITEGLLATDHVVRRETNVFIDNVLFQGTLTSTYSTDWNVTDFNKLGLLVTLAKTGTPTDILLTAEFKGPTGTYYIYQNDFWGDLRWDDTAIGTSTINRCFMGDLPTGTLRIGAVTQGTSTANQFSLTVIGEVYTW